MQSREKVRLSRALDAVQIPSGNILKVPAGSEVVITQALGSSFTVVTPEGYLARIEGKDADALGKSPASPAASDSKKDASVSASSRRSIEEKVWSLLRTCFDPEIPVNIVDLGLIYFCGVTSLSEGGCQVEVKMTLTAPGCGMGEVLRAEAQGKILSISEVKQARIELVWEPHWDQSRMSEAAKLQLGIF